MTDQESACVWWTGRISFDGQDVHEKVKHYLEKNTKLKNWWFQTEKGDNGQKHWQITLQLTKKCRDTSLEDWWKKLVTEVGLPVFYFQPCVKNKEAYAIRYVQKCDSRINGPWSNQLIYLKRDLKCMENPLPWQQTVLDKVKGDPDDRSLMWICDNVGCNGKSKLFKYMGVNKIGSRFTVTTSERIASVMIDRGPQRCYLIDIPRSISTSKSMSDIYEMIEQLKNGYVFSGFYGKDREMDMEPPWVIIFSNYPPELKRCTQDRWDVYEITNDKKLSHMPSEVVKMRWDVIKNNKNL